ncbi:hypothetical protein [Arthrobacter sp. H16F315]|uniref:hypothetical protein n=1 Tax=Arthrobacter sp. H16F315 TaxID=2955314 RepID=UPI00209853DC|nr:hypothetical protein [Arthrobacter sp. H16F315]MDD1477248.1 hypothetical protein [Arthrobacter sp. H16F315]
MDESQDTPLLVAAPRHLHRRYFHEEIADELLVPGTKPMALPASPPSKKANSRSPKPLQSRHQRKRFVALILVVLVALSIPSLVLALVLAG